MSQKMVKADATDRRVLKKRGHWKFDHEPWKRWKEKKAWLSSQVCDKEL